MEDFKIALTEGNTDEVKSFIKSGIDIEASIGIHTALTLVSGLGQIDSVKALLALGADVNKKDFFDNTALMNAAKHGHLDCVKALLNAGASIDSLNHDQWSALSFSATEGHVDCVCLLVDKGADVNTTTSHGLSVLLILLEKAVCGEDLMQKVIERSVDVNLVNELGMTPVMIAAQNGYILSLDLLLRKGANFDTIDKSGKTALMHAALNGHLACIEKLIQSGANVNFMEDDHSLKEKSGKTKKADTENKSIPGIRKKTGKVFQTAIMLASEHGNVKCVQKLIENGADVNLPTCHGDTALTYASEFGHSLCVQALISAGAEINHQKNDFTPILIAAQQGHAECVMCLMDNGADLNGKTFIHSTVLHFLLSHDKVDSQVLKALLKNGADVNAKTRDKKTPLMFAAQFSHIECLELLLAEKAEVNDVSTGGESAVMFAARYGNVECIEKLVKNGADMDLLGKFGDTALSSACKFGKVNCLKTLVDLGASINHSHKDRVLHPLLISVQCNELECAHFLLDQGADPNSRDASGRTVLHELLRKDKCNIEIMKRIIGNGAEVQCVDCDGVTLLMLAAENGHESCLKLLLDKKVNVDELDKKRWSALMYAALEGNAVCLQELLNAGANEWLESKGKLSALAIAVKRNKISCVEIFGEHFRKKGNNGPQELNDLIRKLDLRRYTYNMKFTLAQYGFLQYKALNGVMSFRELVRARFWGSIFIQFNNKGTTLTPLQAAFQHNDLGAVFFLLSNLFLTEADIFFIFSDAEFQRLIQREKSREMIDLLNSITRGPWSLQTLSFIKVSSSVRPFIVGTERSEAVESLPLPPRFKKRLGFYNTFAKLCPRTWSSIEAECPGVNFLLKVDIPDWFEDKISQCCKKKCCNGERLVINCSKGGDLDSDDSSVYDVEEDSEDSQDSSQ